MKESTFLLWTNWNDFKNFKLAAPLKKCLNCFSHQMILKPAIPAVSDSLMQVWGADNLDQDCQTPFVKEV